MVMPEEVQEPQTRCKECDDSHHTSDAGDQAPEECSCLCLKMIEVATIILNMIVICILVNISLRFSMASRLSKNNQSSPLGQDWLLWITSETREDDLVI